MFIPSRRCRYEPEARASEFVRTFSAWGCGFQSSASVMCRTLSNGGGARFAITFWRIYARADFFRSTWLSGEFLIRGDLKMSLDEFGAKKSSNDETNPICLGRSIARSDSFISSCDLLRQNAWGGQPQNEPNSVGSLEIATSIGNGDRLRRDLDDIMRVFISRQCAWHCSPPERLMACPLAILGSSKVTWDRWFSAQRGIVRDDLGGLLASTRVIKAGIRGKSEGGHSCLPVLEGSQVRRTGRSAPRVFGPRARNLGEVGSAAARWIKRKTPFVPMLLVVMLANSQDWRSTKCNGSQGVLQE